METIQTTALLRMARILRRILETCGHSNSSEKPPAKTDVKNSQGVNNNKTTRYLAILLKPHQRDKYLAYLSYKIIGTILEVSKGRTLPNIRENKKTNDDTFGFTSQR